jgi:hypothetical protein
MNDRLVPNSRAAGNIQISLGLGHYSGPMRWRQGSFTTSATMY